MISLEEARRHVLGSCAPLPASRVARSRSLGHVLAETIRSREPVPPFDNTAMDGFAVRAGDTGGAPVSLRVVGTLAAGGRCEVTVAAGQALRIMTGAPVPPGADAIVMVERTHADPEDAERVVVEVEARPGDHVRVAGSDLEAGADVFEPGTVLGPGHVGVLASLGIEEVVVVRRPSVGVLSTGDELADGAQALLAGQIRDSNRPALLATLAAAGFEAVDLGRVPDDEQAITRAVAGGVERCDAVLTSGGVSVGDYDLTRQVLDRMSRGSMRWMQVAIRPAKPFAFGTVGGVPVFGLPGNPVSSLVSFECFARPALRLMAGLSEAVPAPLHALAEEPVRRRPDGRLHLVRAQTSLGADGRVRARSAGAQGSHQLLTMALADALMLVPDGDGLGAGDEVELWPLPGGSVPALGCGR